MASIEKRINRHGKINYRVKIRLKGHPTQTATFDRLTDAKRWTQQTEVAIKEGRYFKTAEAKRHTLNDAIERYMTQTLSKKPRTLFDRKQQLTWWSKQLGDYLLSDISPALLVENREKLASGLTPRGTKRTPSTVNRYLAALSHLFSTAVKEWGWLDNNPLTNVSKLKEPRGRVRYLSNDERERLLSACQGSENRILYLIVLLALSTGARKNEIMQLKWQDVQLERQLIILHETKNSERRALSIMGKAYELLKTHKKSSNSNSGLLFPGNNPNKPLDIRSAWETALKQANITDFRFHDLRHSAASYLAMSGATPADIAAILGHKTLQMVKRYAHLSDSHTARVVAKMNEEFL